MAPRVLLLCVLFTVALLTGRSIGAARLDLTLGFARQPQDVVAIRSRPLTLECAVSSSLPEFNITWTHNGRLLPLSADSRRQLLANGSLYFKKVQFKRTSGHDASDQGEYKCMARNSVGALVSQPARLDIAVLASNFIEFPNATTAQAGDVVRFTCQIDSVPKAVISWEKNGKPLPHNNRMLILDSGDLYLNDVQLTDEGTYRCMAANVVNKKQRVSPEGVLTVAAQSHSENPQALQFLNPLASAVQLHRGKTLLLPCAVVGLPPYEITWIFRGNNSNESVVLNHTTQGVSVMTVYNLTLEHAGDYTCTASRPSTTPISQIVKVDVWVPPYFKANGTPVSESHPPAKTARFKCEAQGIPLPEVIWLKDGKNLQVNGRYKIRSSELVVLNAVTADSGLYQCIARNEAGEIWAAGRLQVNASRFQPDPPHSLTCIKLSSSQIQLNWEPPQRLPSDKLVAYTIHFAPTNGGDESQQVQVNRTHIVDKLAAYTNYTFYVRAYSGKSASDQSARIVCQTGEGVPTASPSFVLDTTSPTTARVVWSPLSTKEARGLITEYKIQWRRSGHPSSNLEEVKGDVREFTITGLNPGKTYEVRVLAATKKGYPDFADDNTGWKMMQTPTYGPQNVPSAPVVNLTAVNSSCVKVSWSFPTSNKYPAIGFKLFYRKQTTQQVGPIFLPANATEFVLDGLEAQTMYEVHVVGVGVDGDGDVGVQSVHTRPDSSLLLLEPPANLEAEPTSPTSINLTWTPPSSVVDVAHYNVSYVPVSLRTGHESEVQYVRSTGTGVEIYHLRPFTLYEFKVRTHDHDNRHGPYSQKLECHTMEDVPGTVQNVRWQPLNNTSIRIVWKEPAQANGVISSYTVFYTQDAALPVDKWRKHHVSGTRVSTEVASLEPKTRYFMLLRATTQAGMGPPSGLITFNTPPVPGELSEDEDTSEPQSSHHLGILIGVTVGVLCVLISLAILIWRRRCMRSSPNQPETVIQHMNGNGYYGDWERPQDSEMQDLELHLSTNIPPANHMLDTKGGYPNGQANGLKCPLLSNGRIPNGHSSRNKNSFHITENPQYKCGDHPRHHVSQESKIHSEADDRAAVEHRVPLLGNTLNCTAISEIGHGDLNGGEGDDEEEEDNDNVADCDSRLDAGLDVADCTQLTQLDMTFGTNSDECSSGSSSSSSSSSRSSGGPTATTATTRNNSDKEYHSNSIECVISKTSLQSSQ